jgi:branched-chain amino acid aminotransferase
MDGKFLKWENANVHVMTHTLHYGFGVFEGIRCYSTKNGSAVFRLREHTSRLFKSAHILGLDIPYTKEKVNEAILETIRKNKLKECYIRPLVYLGNDKLGLNYIGASCHIAIAAWTWGAYLGEDGLKNGIRVKISSFSRHHINVTMTKAKACGAYINSILAKSDAIKDGYDEAILLDVNGNVAEGSGENIFIVRNGILKTPPLTAVLEGITRDAVLQIAKKEGLIVKEEHFARDEIYIADEAFFTGTAAEITPIREVDNRKIGKGKPGPIVKKIQKAFFGAVQGENESFQGWLTYL